MEKNFGKKISEINFGKKISEKKFWKNKLQRKKFFARSTSMSKSRSKSKGQRSTGSLCLFYCDVIMVPKSKSSTTNTITSHTSNNYFYQVTCRKMSENPLLTNTSIARKPSILTTPHKNIKGSKLNGHMHHKSI